MSSGLRTSCTGCFHVYPCREWILSPPYTSPSDPSGFHDHVYLYRGRVVPAGIASSFSRHPGWSCSSMSKAMHRSMSLGSMESAVLRAVSNRHGLNSRVTVWIPSEWARWVVLSVEPVSRMSRWSASLAELYQRSTKASSFLAIVYTAIFID